MHQPVVEGLGAVAEAVLHVLGQGAHGGLAVNVLPEEAAVLVQLDVADPGGVEKLLSQAVVKAPVETTPCSSSLQEFWGLTRGT